jgi:hypothetical protein
MATRCVIETGTPDPECQMLDYLLSQLEEDALHRAAQDFLDNLGTFPRVTQAGFYAAAARIAPYVKIDAFDPDLDEIHPSEGCPDCGLCARGDEHWHRRADNKPVTWSPGKKES